MHNQSGLGVIMDTDATHASSMELQRCTKQRGSGVNRRAFVQGDRPLARCCTALDSALAVRLKRHTGDSNIRNNVGVLKKNS